MNHIDNGEYPQDREVCDFKDGVENVEEKKDCFGRKFLRICEVIKS